MHIACVPTVGIRHGTQLLADLGKVHAILIVDVHDRTARGLSAAPFKQDSLGIKIRLHGVVIVEVVPGEVCENGNIERHGKHALLFEGMRGHLHHSFASAVSESIGQKAIQFQ